MHNFPLHSQTFHFLQAASISIGGAEGADHDQLKEKLAILQSNKLVIERKLDIARSVAESSRQRAIKGRTYTKISKRSK